MANHSVLPPQVLNIYLDRSLGRSLRHQTRLQGVPERTELNGLLHEIRQCRLQRWDNGIRLHLRQGQRNRIGVRLSLLGISGSLQIFEVAQRTESVAVHGDPGRR